MLHSAGRTCVGQLLGLADIDLNVFSLRALSDDHTRIYLNTRSDEQSTSLLCIEQTVSNRLTSLKCDQGTGLTICDITFVLSVAVENCI